MLIRTSADAIGNIRLDSYTFSDAEFSSLDSTLRRARIPINYSPLASDKNGREGRRYSVAAHQKQELQDVLGGTFDDLGKFSIVPYEGSTYACRELSIGGTGQGCQEIVAPDDHVALTLCAIVAGNNKWWGGAAQRGKCPGRRKLMDFLFR